MVNKHQLIFANHIQYLKMEQAASGNLSDQQEVGNFGSLVMFLLAQV